MMLRDWQHPCLQHAERAVSRVSWARSSAVCDGDLLPHIRALELCDFGRSLGFGEGARPLEVVPDPTAVIRLAAAPEVPLVAAARRRGRRARMDRAARRRPLGAPSWSRPRAAAVLARRASLSRCDLAGPRGAGRERERDRVAPRHRLRGRARMARLRAADGVTQRTASRRMDRVALMWQLRDAL